MVTGGFKVWHIIFIIIAFIVTMTVVYCCFHRCRIPRTKQEIEADLMRTNMASKFSYYLLELPNEPITFVEALKKVQELEEKSEQDDVQLSRELGARKRMGWLKKKTKGDKKEGDEEDKNKDNQENPDGVAKLEETDDGEKITELPGSTEPNGEVKLNDTNAPNSSPLEPGKSEATKTEVDMSNKKTEDATEAKPVRKRRHKPGLSRTKATHRQTKTTLDIESKHSGEEPHLHITIPTKESNDKLIENGHQEPLIPPIETSERKSRKQMHHTHHKVRIETKTKTPKARDSSGECWNLSH